MQGHGFNQVADNPTTASDDMRQGVTHHLQATFANNLTGDNMERAGNTLSKLHEQDSAANRSPPGLNDHLNKDVIHNINQYSQEITYLPNQVPQA